MKNKSGEKNPYTAISTKPSKAIFPRTSEEKFDGKLKFEHDGRLGANRKCKS